MSKKHIQHLSISSQTRHVFPVGFAHYVNTIAVTDEAANPTVKRTATSCACGSLRASRFGVRLLPR